MHENSQSMTICFDVSQKYIFSNSGILVAAPILKDVRTYICKHLIALVRVFYTHTMHTYTSTVNVCKVNCVFSIRKF